MKLAIVGAGGCGRSLLSLLRQIGRADEVWGFYEEAPWFEKRQEASLMGLPIQSLSSFDPEKHKLLLALGSSSERLALSQRLPGETRYARCVHPQAFFLEPYEVPAGCIIYPMTYFSRNLQLGPHSLFMTGTILGHDLEIGECFTSSAHVSIGGGARLGKAVFCGLQSAIRDGIEVTDHVMLGMGAMAVKSIKEPGVYIGNPARKRETSASQTQL